MAQQEELLKAGSDDDFWVDAPFFFDMCFFFWRAEVCGSQLVLFLYRWGFKVGNTHHWIHLEEFEFSSSFFFRCFGSNLAQFDQNFGGYNFAEPMRIHPKDGGLLMLQGFPTKRVIYGLLYTAQ